VRCVLSDISIILLSDISIILPPVLYYHLCFNNYFDQNCNIFKGKKYQEIHLHFLFVYYYSHIGLSYKDILSSVFLKSLYL